uniref:Uncharacterized protein n=1 Tax=Anguilla anguilla TaxID=7936 RepID=A0A0E9PT80_ANGAN
MCPKGSSRFLKKHAFPSKFYNDDTFIDQNRSFAVGVCVCARARDFTVCL